MKIKKNSEELVSIAAAISIYVTILFLIFQVLVMVALLIVSVLLVELGIIPKDFEKITFILTLIFSELFLIIALAKHIMSKWNFATILSSPKTDVSNFNEKYLERALNSAAVIGVGWMFLIGIPATSFKIFHVVLQGFGVLFFTIFFFVRLLLTKKTAVRIIVSIGLSIASIVIMANS